MKKGDSRMSEFWNFRNRAGRFIFGSALLLMLALLITACGGGGGGGGDGGGGSSTTSLTVSVFLDESTYTPASATGPIFGPMKPVGTVADVASVWLTINQTSAPASVVQVELTFEPLIGAYTRTVDDLDSGASYEFSAEAFNLGSSGNYATDSAGLKVFNSPSPIIATPLGVGAKIILNLAVVDDGTPFAFPRVSSIAILDNPMLPGSVTSIDVTVSTGDGTPVTGTNETLNWTLGGDPTKGNFLEFNLSCTTNPVAAGTVDILVGNTEGTFTVCYEAPSAEGVYSRSVTVTNAGGDSTTVTFFMFVDLSVLDSGILVYLPPAIVSLEAQRNGYNDVNMTATVVDDKPADSVSYQWDFSATVNAGFATYMTFQPNNDTNPGMLNHYAPDVGGTVTLTATDADGASTLVTLSMPQNLFPDAAAPLGPFAAVEVDSYYAHTCARLLGGNVSCWGARAYGRLGNNSTATGSIVRQGLVVTDAGGTPLSNIAGPISLGYEFSCAVDNVGGVYCWGEGGSGQLGNGSPTDLGLATSVDFGASPTPAISVAAGLVHACALLTGGVVKCWGDNTFEQMGNTSIPNTTDSMTPQASDISGSDPMIAKSIAAGDYFTCAIMDGSTNAGEVWCWGRNYHGELGRNIPADIYNHPGYSAPAPVQDAAGGNLTGVTAIAAGREFACALLEDVVTPANTRVKCWGLNNTGQAGVGATTPFTVDVASPVKASSGVNLDNVVKISAGTSHACALMTDQSVRCWGSGSNGKLGYGGTGTNVYPVQAHYFPGVDVFTQVTASDGSTCAILSGGNMRCWGYNNSGRLGDGTTVDRWWPNGVDYPSLLQ